MYGFPRDTSPYCPGKFCGESTARFTEVVESLYRIVRGTVYDHYQINRTDVSTWIASRDITIPVSRQPIISTQAKECGNEACTITSPIALDIMMYYCSANIDACALAPYNAFPR